MDTKSKTEFLREKQRAWRVRYRELGPSIHRTEKRCCKCAETKPIDQFALSKTSADWRSSTCKPCSYKRTLEWRAKNPEKVRAGSRAQAARAKLLPDEKRLKYSRKWYANNKPAAHKRSLEWRKNNRQKFNDYMRGWRGRKKATDPNWVFAQKVRSKMRLLVRGHRKSASTEKLLGCTILAFKSYLESLWEPWMSWANYGNKAGQWCIDHIFPVEAFDLSDPVAQRVCFHYTNQRPLGVKENREKWHKHNAVELESLMAKARAAHAE